MRRSSRWFASAALLVLLGLAWLPAGAGEEASPDGLWRVLRDPRSVTAGASRWNDISPFDAYELDQDALEKLLREAGNLTDGATLTLPGPGAVFGRFQIRPVTVMDPALAAQFPEIATYAGRGLDDASASVRLTLTPLGLGAQVTTPQGTVLVEPLWRGDTQHYACYRAADAAALAGAFGCSQADAGFGDRALRMAPETAATSGASLRTYRLAVAATGEYTAFFGGTVVAGMAAIVTRVNAINGILEPDVALRFVLVGTNSAVVFTNPLTDPFPLADLNAEAQAANDAFIGDANYDVGHLFHAAGFSGNAGGIGTLCQTGVKGSGFSQSGTPTGSNFTFLVAHEMGHQCGANHSWNGTGCGGEVSPARYEPGSGSTIMSYASICGADNQLGAAVGNLYYHTGSIDQIVTYTTAGAGGLCPAVTITGNNPPTVNGGADFTIPGRTPFTLTATTSDPDGDALTHCWEQFDLGIKAALAAVDEGTIPLFRSFPPVSSTARTFPALADLLVGAPNLFPAKLGEQLPSTNRTLNFRITARDNRVGGGGVNTDDVALTVNAASGPFAVTSPNGGESWGGGTAQTVTWDVAGTSGAPVSTANVNILLSLDGGLTFPTVLAAATPNDGSHVVTLPDCQYISTARVKVEAVGNVYFDISNGNFTMVDVTPPVVTATVTRRVLWPASKGLLKVPLTFSAVDPCGGPTVFDSVTVLSDEGAGVAPYAPDATFVGGVLRLRSERLVPGNGRVYLVVVRFRDGVGNVGAGVASVVVPSRVTVAAVSAALLDAATNQAACLAANGAPPPGYVQVLP